MFEVDDRMPERSETEALTMNGSEYGRKVRDKGLDLHEDVQRWLVELVPWAEEHGFEVNDWPNDGRKVWVQAVAWLGEGFKVRVRPDDEGDYVWVHPPTMPPAELVKYTEGWEDRMGPHETRRANGE